MNNSTLKTHFIDHSRERGNELRLYAHMLILNAHTQVDFDSCSGKDACLTNRIVDLCSYRMQRKNDEEWDGCNKPKQGKGEENFDKTA